MHYVLKLLILLSGAFVFWCVAENFLVQEKSERRRTPQQVRQEIAEVMGEFLSLNVLTLTTKAQVQQELCKQIRSIAENDKDSFFKKSSLRDLQGILKMARHEKDRYEKEIALDKRFLATLRSHTTY